jgi:ATP-dependent DNA ligase
MAIRTQVDGFRCLAFRDNKRIELVSKSVKPLTRYFPELTAALSHLRTTKFVLDGEIVISIEEDLSFDSLLMRIHPSKTRVKRLSQDTPSLFIVFDLLVNPSGKSLVGLPLMERRTQLERFTSQYLARDQTVRLSPLTLAYSAAKKWFHMGTSMDGVIAKRRDLP